MKNQKSYIITGIFILLVISLSIYVSAFGIGSAYHENAPLRISPGETKEIIFNLQNMPGPNDITARPGVSQGSEIIKINSGDILVPVGGSVDVKAKVTIPGNAEIGDIYPVMVTFTALTPSESGSFSLGSSVGRKFNVVIGEDSIPNENKISLWIYLVAGIILILIIILFLRRKNKKKKSK